MLDFLLKKCKSDKTLYQCFTFYNTRIISLFSDLELKWVWISVSLFYFKYSE